MRTLLLVLTLTMLPLAGCLEPEPLVLVDSTPVVYQKDVVTELPERRFEPTLEFEPNHYEVPQGTDVNFSFAITDLDDYDYPMTFIDWAIIYERDPNPVAEGDATQVPGSWNRTLYAEDYHMFLFRADDGQGFLDRKVVIIQVGEPDEETPSPQEIKLFVHEAEVMMGAAEPLPPPKETAPADNGESKFVTFEGSVAYPCEGGPGGASDVQDAQTGIGAGCAEEAEECVGWVEGINELDCWWFPIEDRAMWNQPFTTTGNDPDIWFYEYCPHTNLEDGADAEVSHAVGHFGRPVKVGSSAHSGLESGRIPIWTGCVVMYEWGGVIANELGDGASAGSLSMTIDITNEWDGDKWVQRDEENVCHATHYHTVYPEGNGDVEFLMGLLPPEAQGSIVYVHERTATFYPRTPGYEVWNIAWDGNEGDGTWFYQESNGVPGLQVGNGGVFYENDPDEIWGESAAYSDCANPDTLIF